MGENELAGAIHGMVDDCAKEITDLCIELVRIPSVSNDGREKDVIAVLSRKLRENGIDVQVEDIFDGRGNVIATIGRAGSHPALLYNGHVDVVPVPANEKWRKEMDPYAGIVTAGKIYGRGTVDMKGNVASMVMAAIVLQRLGIQLEGRLVLNFVSDEEMGGKHGTLRCLQNHRQHLDVDAAIIGEPTMLAGFPACISFSEKGILWVEIETYGSSGHASIGELESSAITKMVRIIQGIEEKFEYPVEPRFSIDALRRYLEEAVGQDIGRELYEKQPLIKGVWDANTKLTRSLTILKAGQKENQIPSSCIAVYDIRFLVEHDPETIISKMKHIVTSLGFKLVDETGRQGDARISIRLLSAASRMDNHGATIVGVIKDAHENVFKRKTMLIAFPATSDAKYFRNEGIIPGVSGSACKDTVLFGAGEANLSHAANEAITIKDLISITKAYAMIAAGYLGGKLPGK